MLRTVALRSTAYRNSAVLALPKRLLVRQQSSRPDMVQEPFGILRQGTKDLDAFRRQHSFATFRQWLGGRKEGKLSSELVRRVEQALNGEPIILERLEVFHVANAFRGKHDLSKMVTHFRNRRWSAGWNSAKMVLFGKKGSAQALASTYRDLLAADVSCHLDLIFTEVFILPDGSRIPAMGEGRNAHLLNVLAPGFVLLHPELIDALVRRINPVAASPEPDPLLKAAVTIFLENLLDQERWFGEGRSKEVYIGGKRALARGNPRAQQKVPPHFFWEFHPESP